MPERHPRSYLTLSAVAGLHPDDPRIASAIERELEKIERARRRGRTGIARHRTDRLIEFVFGQVAA